MRGLRGFSFAAIAPASIRGITGIFAGINKLKIFTVNGQLAALLAIFFPGVEFKAAFNEKRPTLAEELADRFCRASPESNIDKGCFFLSLAIATVEDSIDGHADIRDSCPLRGVTKFRVPREVPHQKYLIKAGHKFSPVLTLVLPKDNFRLQGNPELKNHDLK
jgi:hypothetical protein